MPTTRITMRQIRQALRLHLEAGLSYAQVARAIGIGKGTVGKFLLLARAAGVDWAVAQALSDVQLEERLYRPAVPRASRQLEPDCAWIHQELKRPGVTLQLLWEEYQRGSEPAYKYTSFCIKYRAWALGLKRSMRQAHIAGERLFVDYAGQTVAIIDAGSGEIRRAQIFVAVLGASNYTYACATATQTAADWVGSIIEALEFVGGVPGPLRARGQPPGRGVLRPLRRGGAPSQASASGRPARSKSLQPRRNVPWWQAPVPHSEILE